MENYDLALAMYERSMEIMTGFRDEVLPDFEEDEPLEYNVE